MEASTPTPPSDDAPRRLDLSALQASLGAIRAEVRKRLVGQDDMLDLLLAALLADGHVLIEGVPGVAKTLAAKLLARTVSADFARIQFTPDLMPSDILGTSVFDPGRQAFEFKPGPIFANLVLVDEVNRAPAKTQSALFEVMEERQITVDGTTHALAPPFVVLATQNPLEHEGTYRLPEAQLDRFLFKIEVGYPSIAEEAEILAAHHGGRDAHALDDVAPVLTPETLAACRALVRRVHVEPAIMDYIARLSAATRGHPALVLGASPRASLALLAGAKAFAALAERDFVTPDDVRAVAAPVLRHRVLLAPEQELEGKRPDDVVRAILSSVEVPR